MEASVHLLHGLQADGAVHRHALVRDLTGYDEALVEALDTPVRAATALIGAAVTSIGEIAPITARHAAQLTVGDRERLLIAMSIMASGDRRDLAARCPSASCGELSDVQLRLSDFLAPQAAGDSAPTATLTLKGPGGAWTLTIRPPTGVDQEAVVHGSADAARSLIVSCLLSLIAPSQRRAHVEDLPAALEAGVSDALLAIDPAAEILSRTACPACGTWMDMLLDGVELLRSSLAGSVDRDVYRMARAYHWGEAEILRLPIKRRKRYLAIADGLEAGA